MEEGPDDRKRWRTDPKPKEPAERINDSRREFVTGAGTIAAVNALGIAEGFILKGASSDRDRNKAAEVAQYASAEESVGSQTTQETLDAFSNGDQDSIKQALKIIDYYAQELDLKSNHHKNLRQELGKLLGTRSNKRNKGLEDFLKSEIQFSEQQEEFLKGEIERLKGLIRLSAEKSAPGGPGSKKFGVRSKTVEG